MSVPESGREQRDRTRTGGSRIVPAVSAATPLTVVTQTPEDTVVLQVLCPMTPGSLISETDHRNISSEEGSQGRCPPCLLGHRGATRGSASLKRQTSRARPRRRILGLTRPTSAPTNGSWRSCTSGTWPIPVLWTGRGGASSPTTSLRSPTEPAPSPCSRPPRSRPRQPLRPRQLRHPRRPPRLRGSLPRPPCPLARAQPRRPRRPRCKDPPCRKGPPRRKDPPRPRARVRRKHKDRPRRR